MESLGTALPAEMVRIRDVVIPAYQEVGPTAALAIAFIRIDLEEAEQAIADGNIAAMIRAYQALKEYKL